MKAPLEGSLLVVPGALLVGAWVLATAPGHAGAAAAGGLLIGGVAWVFYREIPRRSRGRPPSFKRVLWGLFGWALFLPVFGWIVLRSGIQIAWLALKPSMDFWPGIVRIRGGLPHRTATTLFAHLITLTPGTLALDYDEERDHLYVHWIDVADTADGDLDRRVSSGMRSWVRRFFG